MPPFLGADLFAHTFSRNRLNVDDSHTKSTLRRVPLPIHPPSRRRGAFGRPPLPPRGEGHRVPRPRPRAQHYAERGRGPGRGRMPCCSIPLPPHGDGPQQRGRQRGGAWMRGPSHVMRWVRWWSRATPRPKNPERARGVLTVGRLDGPLGIYHPDATLHFPRRLRATPRAESHRRHLRGGVVRCGTGFPRPTCSGARPRCLAVSHEPDVPSPEARVGSEQGRWRVGG